MIMNLAWNVILATEATTTSGEESGGIDLLLPAPEETKTDTKTNRLP